MKAIVRVSNRVNNPMHSRNGQRWASAMKRWKHVAALLGLFACQGAHAKQWVICDLTVLVTKVQKVEQQISGVVRSSIAPKEADCPVPEARVTFLPATPDYQGILPTKMWPKPGEVVQVRYRYLIGACKYVDVCKIEHYSVLR